MRVLLHCCDWKWHNNQRKVLIAEHINQSVPWCLGPNPSFVFSDAKCKAVRCAHYAFCPSLLCALAKWVLVWCARGTVCCAHSVQSVCAVCYAHCAVLILCSLPWVMLAVLCSVSSVEGAALWLCVQRGGWGCGAGKWHSHTESSSCLIVAAELGNHHLHRHHGAHLHHATDDDDDGANNEVAFVSVQAKSWKTGQFCQIGFDHNLHWCWRSAVI